MQVEPNFNFMLMYFSLQSSLGSSSVPYHPRWSPYRDVMPTYNQLAASSLLSQQYNAALGLGDACSRLSPCLLNPQLLKPWCCICTCFHSSWTSWPPSQKSSHGGAGCPDGAIGQHRPEEGKRINSASEQAASLSSPALQVGGFPGSEREHSHQ